MTLLNYTDPVPTPAPLTSGSGIQSYTDPLGDVWVAANGVNGGVWKRARDVLHARWYRAAAFTITSGPVAMLMDTAAVDAYGLYSSAAGGAFTAPVAGIYTASITVSLSVSTANAYCSSLFGLNNTAALVAVCNMYATGTAWTLTPSVTMGSIRMNAGDLLLTLARTTNSGGAGGLTGLANTVASFDYLGTG